MLLPPKFCWIALTADEFTPGAGMCVPSRYSASISAVNRTLLRMSRILNAPRIVETIGLLLGRRSAAISWQVPPAASMRSRAVLLKPCAWTVSALLRSPFARTLTGTSLRVARPFACIASRVTAAPASKRCSRSQMLTGWVWVRNGSNGIDFFIVGPRSLRIRI